MKRLIKLLVLPLILILTGCMQNESMENITIYTTSYPIEYITKQLYGDHATIKSIYPNGVDINKFKLTDTLIKQYNDNDLYIFNSLSNEKDYVRTMRNNNKNLKIIDVTSDITYENAVEELWLDPSNLLSLANNIKKGFNEYIKNNTILTNEIEKNYDELKFTLTNLESEYREELGNYRDKTIIVSDDMFLFLNNYGLNVISLDKDNEEYEQNYIEAIKFIQNGYINYIFVPDVDEIDNDIKNLQLNIIPLYTISNLTDEQRENYDYVSLIQENLEKIKGQLASS